MSYLDFGISISDLYSFFDLKNCLRFIPRSNPKSKFRNPKSHNPFFKLIGKHFQHILIYRRWLIILLFKRLILTRFPALWWLFMSLQVY